MVFGNGVKNIQAAAYNGARTVLMSGSCHIQRVEIVVELGIFVFFQFLAEKKLQLNFKLLTANIFESGPIPTP